MKWTNYRAVAHGTRGTFVDVVMLSNRNGASDWPATTSGARAITWGVPTKQAAVAKRLLSQRAVVRSKQPNGDSAGGGSHAHSAKAASSGHLQHLQTADKHGQSNNSIQRDMTCRHLALALALSKDAPGVEERPSGPSVVQNGEGESRAAVCVYAKQRSVQVSKCPSAKCPSVHAPKSKAGCCQACGPNHIGSSQSAGPPTFKSDAWALGAPARFTLHTLHGDCRRRIFTPSQEAYSSSPLALLDGDATRLPRTLSALDLGSDVHVAHLVIVVLDLFFCGCCCV